jgi:hypothetical protein
VPEELTLTVVKSGSVSEPGLSAGIKTDQILVHEGRRVMRTKGRIFFVRWIGNIEVFGTIFLRGG